MNIIMGRTANRHHMVSLVYNYWTQILDTSAELNPIFLHRIVHFSCNSVYIFMVMMNCMRENDICRSSLVLFELFFHFYRIFHSCIDSYRFDKKKALRVFFLIYNL